MKKTLFLSAILGAALCSSAFGATTYNEVTYSGHILNIATSDSATFHNRNFSDFYKNGEDTWVNGKEFSGAQNTYYYGADTTGTNAGTNTWNYFFGAGNGKYSTLRLTGATKDIYLETQFTPLTLGGLIVEAGDYTYTIGRKSGDCAVTIQAENGQQANMTIGANTRISAGTNATDNKGHIAIESAGTWNIAEGKSLTLAHFDANNNETAVAGGIRVNAAVTLTGSGTLKLNGANLTFGANGSITVGANNTLALQYDTGWTMDEHAPLTSGNGYSTATYTREFGTSLVNNGTITLDGNNVTLTDGVASATGNSVNYYINDATTYSSNADFANARKVIINNNVTVTGATGGENGFFHEEVVVNGSLTMGNKDLMGWGGTYVKKLTLEDGATIKLTHNTNETFSGALTMKGTSTITGATASADPAGQWDIHGNSSITVEAGATATISTRELRTRHDNVAISVGDRATLTVSANLTKNGGNGVINKTGSGTLTITGSIANDITLNNNAGTTIVKDVTLTGGTFKGVTFNNAKVNGTITLNNLTGDGNLQTALSGLTKSDAQGASSTIKLGSGEYTFNAETTVNAHHLVFGGNTEINGHGYDGTGHVITLSNGASVDAGANELKIESKATLKLLTNDTSVTSGSVILGHNTVTNPNQTKNVGTLTMIKGSITTGFIKKNTGYANTDNTFTMTGGTLTFTKPASETVMVDGPDRDEEGNPIQIEQTNTYNAIDGVTATITSGTLSTAQAAWKIDNADVTLGAVTISGAHAATLSHVKLGSGTKIHTNTTVDGGITSVSSSTDKYAFLVENNSTLTLTGADYDLTNAGAGIGLQTGSSVIVDKNASLTLKTFVYSSDSKTWTTSNGSATVKEDATLAIEGNGYRDAFLSSMELQGKLNLAAAAKLHLSTITGSETASLVVNGSMEVVNADATTVGSLTLGSGAKLTLGTEQSHNVDLTTSGLTVNGDATLNANLVMNSGTLSITAGNTLTMGCSVTIGDTVEVRISGADAEAIRHGSELTIINLGQLAATDAITLGSASIYIDNAEQNDFSLMRVDDADGTSRIVVAPEPATATLSLLALAALATRRKRH